MTSVSFFLPFHSIFVLVTLGIWFILSSSSRAEESDNEGVQTFMGTGSEKSSCESHPTGIVNDGTEMGDDAKEFLREEVFGQNINYKSGFLSMLDENDVGRGKEEKMDPSFFFSFLKGLSQAQLGKVESEDKTKKTSPEESMKMTKLIEKLWASSQEEDAFGGLELLSLFGDTFTEVARQLGRNFGDVLAGVDGTIPLAFVYYGGFIDRVLTPSKKRQLHRFYNKVPKDEMIQLHDGLYLSALAYCDTVDAFRAGLATFQDNNWELLYGTTDSLPHLPAHFLMIHKQLAPLEEPSIKELFLGKKETEVVVVLVVRGTKYLSDALADSLLEPGEYKGGYAHGGILASGKALAAKHLSRLKDLHEFTGRDRIRLVIVGHSLGAGAGAIAAMEFHEHSFIKVEAVGFGCPGLLSRELADTTKGYITTVINDADIIPRMSGASMANLIMDVIEYDWTEDALEDIGFSLDRARDLFDFGKMLPEKESVLKWVNDFMDKEIRPKLKADKRERIPSQLIPPGTCIHLFRDGYGFSATYMPCDYFSSVELSRNIVDDHMIGSGYQRGMLAVVQDMDRDYSFQFSNDVVALGA